MRGRRQGRRKEGSKGGKERWKEEGRKEEKDGFTVKKINKPTFLTEQSS